MGLKGSPFSQMCCKAVHGMPERSHLAVALVRPAPVNQEQASQVLELGKGKVAGQYSRATLPPADAHPNVRCLNHAHIIGAIANACSNRAKGAMPAATGYRCNACNNRADACSNRADACSNKAQTWQGCNLMGQPAADSCSKVCDVPVWASLPVPAAAGDRSGSTAVHQGGPQQRCWCLQQQASFLALQGTPEQPLALLLIPAPALRSCANGAAAGHKDGRAGPLARVNDPLCVTDTQPAACASTRHVQIRQQSAQLG